MRSQKLILFIFNTQNVQSSESGWIRSLVTSWTSFAFALPEQGVMMMIH